MTDEEIQKIKDDALREHWRVQAERMGEHFAGKKHIHDEYVFLSMFFGVHIALIVLSAFGLAYIAEKI